MGEIRQAQIGSIVFSSDSPATKADIARLEAKIDRLLAVPDPPKPSTIVEFAGDGNVIRRAILPHVSDTTRKANP